MKFIGVIGHHAYNGEAYYGITYKLFDNEDAAYAWTENWENARETYDENEELVFMDEYFVITDVDELDDMPIERYFSLYWTDRTQRCWFYEEK